MRKGIIHAYFTYGCHRKLSEDLRQSEEMVNQLKAQIVSLKYENKHLKTNCEVQKAFIGQLWEKLQEEERVNDALNR